MNHLQHLETRRIEGNPPAAHGERRNSAILDHLLEHSTDEIYVFHHTSLRFQQVSRSAESNLGYAKPELIRLTPAEILGLSRKELEAALDPLRRGASRALQLVASHHRKDGSTYPVELSMRLSSFEEGPVFLAIAHDLTRQKRAEQEIKVLAQAIKSISEAVTVTDMEDNIRFVNEAFLDTYGYDKHELIGKSIAIVRSPDSPAEVSSQILPATLQGGWQGEVLNVKKDGSQFPAFLSTSVVRDDCGTPIALIGVDRDITRQKAAEEALRESEARFRDLFNKAPVGLYRAAADGGKILACNPHSARLLGYRDSEACAREFIIEENLAPAFRKELGRRMSRDGTVRDLKVKLRRPDGVEIWVRLSAKVFPERGLVEGSLLDITETERAKEEHERLTQMLQQSQKLQTIGTLAGGIAHDFNNLLTPIIGYTEMVLREISAGNPVADDLENVLQAAHRARDLVYQILTFSRRTGGKKEPVEIRSVVEEALKLVEASLPSTIKIRREIDGGCGLVRADSTQIHQVVMNICTNAYQSMRQEGGLLEVTVASVTFEEEFGSDHPDLPVGAGIKISIRDSGPGMEKETLDRIFEPFFSTKPPGEGLGLGLSVVHGIVVNHGGVIRVDSWPGEGSAFHTYLPTIEEEENTISPRPASGPARAVTGPSTAPTAIRVFWTNSGSTNERR